MNLRTYKADTIADALQQVRRELGRNAVILHTRTVRQGGWLGFGGRPVVEITAADDVNVLPRRRTERTVHDREQNVPALRAEGTAMPAIATPPDSGAPPATMNVELARLRDMVEGLAEETRAARMPALPRELKSIYQKLVGQQVAEELAARLVHELRDRIPQAQWSDADAVNAVLVEKLKEMLPVAGPLSVEPDGSPRVVMLIGPTGVGKTTTIAKLAAHYHLREQKKVGLITIDTYRIAAVDQLKTYAEILGVPLRVVLSPAELKEAIALMGDRDLILIDTAGRSQNDDIKLNELRRFIREVKPHEIHAVLAGTGSRSTLEAAARRFNDVGADRIIFTKLDETVGIGVMLDVLRKVKRKVSYVTTGQRVPNDIAIGQSDELARLIVSQI